MASAGGKLGKERKKTQMEIVNGFNALRNEQGQVVSKMYELEGDLQEHKVVIESLKVVNEDRKCYRMIGGVLVERTVKQVLPELSSNAEKLKMIIDNLNEKMVEKGKEILDYKEKHNIQFQLPPTPSTTDRILEEDETGAEAEGVTTR